MAQFCIKCGNEIKPGSKFCMKCGSPVKEPFSPNNKEKPVPVVDGATKQQQSQNMTKKIILIAVTLIVIFGLFSIIRSAFEGPADSPNAVMNTYGKYCIAVFNNTERNEKDYFKLFGENENDRKSHSLMVDSLRSALPNRRGEITYAIMKKPTTNGNKVMCGVMFYDKKTNEIFFEHVMALEKQSSGSYILDGVVINAGGRNKKLYQ